MVEQQIRKEIHGYIGIEYQRYQNVLNDDIVAIAKESIAFLKVSDK